ncbi:MAG: MYXO-CTERM sorting domain-containing protein [Nannocystaceae bacterium]
MVFDRTWVHTPELPDSHYREMPDAGTPADWTSPVDFTQGSAWVYLEVHTKPTAQETKFQVCFEATPTYACTDQSPTYTDVGTYEWETPFANFWSPPGEFVDWTQGVANIACILKDTRNGKPSADNVGPEVAALYTPTEVRMVVTLVEAGSVYEPPTPSGETEGGSEGGSGSSDGGASTGAGDGGDTTATSDASTSASAGEASGGRGDDGGAGAAGSSGGDSSSAGAAAGGDDGGCSCTSGPAQPGAAWSWLAIGLAIARRRARRRAR